MITVTFRSGRIAEVVDPNGNVEREISKYGVRCDQHKYINPEWYRRDSKFTGLISYDNAEKSGPGIWTGTVEHL